MINPSEIIYALLGGILPALIWLLFWLHEDSKRPEPRKYIVRTFIFGMLSVVFVVPFQLLAKNGLGITGELNLEALAAPILINLLFLWAVAEEVFKFVAAYFGGLDTPEDDEPIDPIIYMITAALGFAALENALFLFDPRGENGVLVSLFAGNMRFIGPSLLHVIASATIGVSLSFAFYKGRTMKIIHGVIGLGLAIVIHTAFNMMMLAPEISVFATFGLVWLTVIVLLLMFEKVKTIRQENTPTPLHTEFKE